MPTKRKRKGKGKGLEAMYSGRAAADVTPMEMLDEAAPVQRSRRGPAPDPDRAKLVPVLYRVTPEDRDALRDEARQRAADLRAHVDEERARARAEGRKPRAATVREDASEVLREVLAKWRKSRRA